MHMYVNTEKYLPVSLLLNISFFCCFQSHLLLTSEIKFLVMDYNDDNLII